METLSMTGLQQLCRLYNPQWISKRLPVYQVGGSASGTYTSGSQIGTHCFQRSQRDFGNSGRVFSSLINSATVVNNSVKPISCGLRGTFIRSRNSCPLDRRGATLWSDSLQIGYRRKRIRFSSLATTGDGSSVNASDSTFDEEGTDQHANRPNTSSSLWPRWNSTLKQVDWNKIIFNWREDEPMWKVPWTGQTIFQVMILWFAAFWVMGSWVLPIGAQVAGFSRHSLTFRGQALYSLITDIAEGTVGIWILRRCLAQFFPLPHGWFPVKWQGKWLVEACWGCLLFPFVNKLSQLNLYLIPLPNLTTSYVEHSMMSRDPIATLLYAIVISVCAPVWEEVIFRGFLLPSMTRYMPLWGAIFVSALAFALAHFSMQRILPLTFLGLVMGFVFVRSKNLLASIVLHSLWNGFAFLELL